LEKTLDPTFFSKCFHQHFLKIFQDFSEKSFSIFLFLPPPVDLFLLHLRRRQHVAAACRAAWSADLSGRQVSPKRRGTMQGQAGNTGVVAQEAQ
jgi:hypothetical protein